MTKNDAILEATRLVEEILKAQPNLFSGRAPTATAGNELADFVDAFITRYSGQLLARSGTD